jgi:large subunit ribosomal protein L30e
MADLQKSISLAVKTGKVTFGYKETLEAVRGGKAKLIIAARNLPAEKRRELQSFSKISDTPLLQYEGSSISLGTVCGKPFTVSIMAVRDPGDSDILKQVT